MEIVKRNSQGGIMLNQLKVGDLFANHPLESEKIPQIFMLLTNDDAKQGKFSVVDLGDGMVYGFVDADAFKCDGKLKVWEV